MSAPHAAEAAAAAGTRPRLEVDADQLGRFYDALFRYAPDGTFISLRVFDEDRGATAPLKKRGCRILHECRDAVLQEVVSVASFAANHPRRAVFAPPVVLLDNPKSAAETDVAAGVTLPVELDQKPNEARRFLESLLGTATITIASGGTWTDPETGEIQDKLHIHWRLSEPTTCAEAHARLKAARRLAQQLVGADGSAVPLVHPLRWPGSWHRKAEPKLAQIVDENPDAEIDLDEALEMLRDAWGSRKPNGAVNGAAAGTSTGTTPECSAEVLHQLAEIIPNPDLPRDQWNLFGMAFWAASGGSEDGLAAFQRFSAKSTKHRSKSEDGAAARWAGITRSPPTRVGLTSLINAARRVDPNFPDPRAARSGPHPAQPIIDKMAQRAEPAWPAPLEEAAFHGIAGAVVRAIEPHSESDPAALLLQFLSAFGNAVGRGPYIQVEGDRHPTQLWAVIVGETSKARKGTSAGRIRQLFETAAPLWNATRVVGGGLSSGEGVITKVRDPIIKRTTDKKTGEITEEVLDEGVDDKRLLVIEAEFASALRQAERGGNTLSATLRCFWDRGTVGSLTKNSPAHTTNSLVSIVGHISVDELRRYMTRTELAAGLANRFLFACSRRSKSLPFGGGEIDLAGLGGKVSERIGWAEARGELRVGWTDGARAIWTKVYSELSDGRPGMFGAATSRAEAQVLRLALVYAVLDRSAFIEPEHLHAALAVWAYCDASAAFIFGTSLGDPVADEIHRALAAVPNGMSRTAIRNLFSRNESSEAINRALEQLALRGMVRCETKATGGRPEERCMPSDPTFCVYVVYRVSPHALVPHHLSSVVHSLLCILF